MGVQSIGQIVHKCIISSRYTPVRPARLEFRVSSTSELVLEIFGKRQADRYARPLQPQVRLPLSLTEYSLSS
jgi:hypothetical protein